MQANAWLQHIWVEAEAASSMLCLGERLHARSVATAHSSRLRPISCPPEKVYMRANNAARYALPIKRGCFHQRDARAGIQSPSGSYKARTRQARQDTCAWRQLLLTWLWEIAATHRRAGPSRAGVAGRAGRRWVLQWYCTLPRCRVLRSHGVLPCCRGIMCGGRVLRGCSPSLGRWRVHGGRCSCSCRVGGAGADP
jgi:hypothetical protein